MFLHESAHADDEERDGGQRLVAKHVVENRFELRHDENEQERHDRDRQRHDDDRINHRGDDLVFDLGRFFLELGQPSQDHFKHAADLAGFHHVDVKIVEDARMLREAVGKSAAALHGIGQFVDRVFQNRIAFLFAQNVRPRNSGRPESISVASCRVKIISTFGLTFLRWKRTMFFVPRARELSRRRRAGLAARRARFPSTPPPLPSS